MKKLWPSMDKNLKIEPRAEEKFENAALSGQKVRKTGPKNGRTLEGLIHMYPATKSGRSKSGPFVIDDYLL